MDRIALKHGLWLVVADGEKALFLQNEGDATYPNFEVVREMEQENPPTREQGSDRPGRFNDGPSAHRSAVADTDWHQVGKVRFADEIAGPALQDGASRRLQGDRAGRTAAGARRDAQEAAPGSVGQGRRRNPEDAHQPRRLRHRENPARRLRDRISGPSPEHGQFPAIRATNRQASGCAMAHPSIIMHKRPFGSAHRKTNSRERPPPNDAA